MLNGGKRGPDAGIVGYSGTIEGYVKVSTNEDEFSRNVDITNTLLWHPFLTPLAAELQRSEASL